MGAEHASTTTTTTNTYATVYCYLLDEHVAQPADAEQLLRRRQVGQRGGDDGGLFSRVRGEFHVAEKEKSSKNLVWMKGV